jgi:RNA 2',3'-cyclic 3'-phosphodiesterase
MRLFIALELPEAVRAELAATQARLRAGTPPPPLRWADPAGFHLTLQFLGEAPASLVAPLAEALAALPAPPLSLRLDGLGAFPNLRRPQVVWVGVAGDTAALAALRAEVLAATAPLGFGVEARDFRPHLTLGRAQRTAHPLRLEALGTAIERAAPPAPLSWPGGRPILFQSTLGAGGAVYTRLTSP